MTKQLQEDCLATAMWLCDEIDDDGEWYFWTAFLITLARGPQRERRTR